MISVIMAAYNASQFITKAIESVLAQTYTDWELLIIDDGSTDNTQEKIFCFSDTRIRYFYQLNSGVSSARNIGFENMRGEFFCILDADDVFPENSLKSRLEIFYNSPIPVEFVDGSVELVDEVLTPLHLFKPRLKRKNPFYELIALKDTCYIKQSWLIKRMPGKVYRMNRDLTHGEDLFFSMCISRQGGIYTYTDEVVLLYRRHKGSSMSNLEGLNYSYYFIFNAIRVWPEVSFAQRFYFFLKARKIMFLSFLFNGKSVYKAFKSLIKWE